VSGPETSEAEHPWGGDESSPELTELGRAARHDLSELLGASALHAELLARSAADALDERGRRHLDALRLGLSHLQTLLDGLAEYTWAASDPLQPSSVDLEALTEEVAEGLRPPLERQGGSLTVGPLPTVVADVPRVRTVLAHLLRNAVTHAGREDVHVDVSAEREGDAWQISVADDGQGMSEHERSEVLRPFTRRGRSNDERTAGLGLSISAVAVKRHGGKLWIDEADPGAVVRFTLPDR
jgi:signal transduction histidine kinase